VADSESHRARNLQAGYRYAQYDVVLTTSHIIETKGQHR